MGYDNINIGSSTSVLLRGIMSELTHDPQQDYIASLEARVREIEQDHAQAIYALTQEETAYTKLEAQLAALTQAHQQAVIERDFVIQEKATLLDSFCRLQTDVTLASEKQAAREVVELKAQLQQAVEALRGLVDEVGKLECTSPYHYEGNDVQLAEELENAKRVLATHKEKD